MNMPRVHDPKQIYLQLENTLQFRLNRMKETEDFFIAEINDKKKMSNPLNKYVTILYDVDKTVLLFTTTISTPVSIPNASIRLVS